MEREETLYRMFGRFCPQGTILFSENAPAEEMYYLQSGRVRLTQRGGERGEPSQSRELEAGALLGVDAFMGKGRRRMMAETTEDSRLLVLSPANLESVVRNGPELSSAVVEALLDRLGASWTELRDWQCSRAWERVKKRLETAAGNRSWYVGDLSAETGVEEVVVRMILVELEKAGAMASEGGSYTVRNPDLLRTAAAGEPNPD